MKKKPQPKPVRTSPKQRLERFKRTDKSQAKIKEAISSAPKITNETVAEHREQVLSSARKYIYPLQHSRRRIITISASIIGAGIILFFIVVGVALYQFQVTSSFFYGVTQVVPLPVARAGGRWVSYESYLFELRRYMHYYQTQQAVNFNSATGQRQLANFKQQAMQTAITNAYVDDLAKQNNVTVSGQQVANEVALLKRQNRLGSSNAQFDAVLNDFWGWNENDFNRELHQQLLDQAVVAKLDVQAEAKANTVLSKLKQGQDFATLASQYSDDTSTKSNGGQFPAPISYNDPNVNPVITQALFQLKPNQYSAIVDTGYSLEIVKLVSIQDGKATGAHIQINLQPLQTYIKPLAKSKPAHYYISLPKS